LRKDLRALMTAVRYLVFAYGGDNRVIDVFRHEK
jgi:hypothetical protein